MAKILLIEDDQQLAASIKEQLENAQHVVEHVAEGQEGFDRLKLYSYDVAVLDWMLPDIAGIDVLKQFRDIGGVTPVLMLTGKSDVDFRVQGFSSGADDYLTKPFDMRELLSRVRALLRRPPVVGYKTIVVRDIELDPVEHTVTMAGAELKLYPKEFSLLQLFMLHPKQVFSADDLLDRVWPTDSEASIETVRQTILRLRQKVERESEAPLIQTVRGFGYRLEP